MSKYLFKCLLNSGEIITQNETDQSTTTPNKNTFWDVLQRLNEVRAFGLYNQENGDEWLVSIEDGHFEHNMQPFLVGDEGELANRRLIYFKRNIMNALNGEKLNEVFFIGYQGNRADGSNAQCKIGVC